MAAAIKMDLFLQVRPPYRSSFKRRLGGAHIGGVRFQSSRQFVRPTKCQEMPPGHLVRRYAETFVRYPSLEVRGKEPVIAHNKHASWHGRPGLEGTGRREDGVGLAWLALRPGLVDHWLRYVMSSVHSVGSWTDMTVMTAA